jgi:predicted transcriptional regulator
VATSTSIKLSDGLRERVQAIAEDEDRSANWLMNDAISKYVDRKEHRKALRQQMRDAHEEYQRTGLHLTQDEVREWMEKRARGERASMPKLHT